MSPVDSKQHYQIGSNCIAQQEVERHRDCKTLYIIGYIYRGTLLDFSAPVQGGFLFKEVSMMSGSAPEHFFSGGVTADNFSQLKALCAVVLTVTTVHQ